jgi:hypothetical protein
MSLGDRHLRIYFPDQEVTAPKEMLRNCSSLVAETRAADWLNTTCPEIVNRMAKDHAFRRYAIDYLIR